MLESVSVDLRDHRGHAKKKTKKKNHEPFVRQVEQIRDKVASYANCFVRSRVHIRVLNSEFSRPLWKCLFYQRNINLMFIYGETFEKLKNTRLSRFCSASLKLHSIPRVRITVYKHGKQLYISYTNHPCLTGPPVLIQDTITTKRSISGYGYSQPLHNIEEASRAIISCWCLDTPTK